MQFYSIQIVQGSEKSNISSCRSFKVNVFDLKVKYFNSFRLEHLPSPSVRGMKEDKSWYFLCDCSQNPGLLSLTNNWWNCINEFETFDKIFIRTFLNLIYYQEYSIKKSSVGFMLRIKTAPEYSLKADSNKFWCKNRTLDLKTEC